MGKGEMLSTYLTPLITHGVVSVVIRRIDKDIEGSPLGAPSSFHPK